MVLRRKQKLVPLALPCGPNPYEAMADNILPSYPLFLPEADSYLTRFTVPQMYNYSVLLVDPASHTLYVGARDIIFALSLPFSGERSRRVRDESWEDPQACD